VSHEKSELSEYSGWACCVVIDGKTYIPSKFKMV